MTVIQAAIDALLDANRLLAETAIEDVPDSDNKKVAKELARLLVSWPRAIPIEQQASSTRSSTNTRRLGNMSSRPPRRLQSSQSEHDGY